MDINIRNIVDGRSSEKLELHLSDEFSNLGNINPVVDINIDYFRVDTSIKVTITYKSKVTLNCGRCLKDYEDVVSGEVLFYIESEKANFEDNGEFDIYTYKSEGDTIKFDQTLYEDIVLRTPKFKICSENCDGGIYKNDDKTCIKAEEPIMDSRWEQLKKLKN